MSEAEKGGPGTAAMDLPEDALAPLATRASAYYEPLFALRALIQAIPGIGGTIDTILAGLGARWQAERLESFLRILSERLARLEATGVRISLEPSEPLYDFVRLALEQAARTRSEQKRQDLATIVTHQASATKGWDDAEAAMSVLSELSEFDVAVLTTAVHADPCGDPFLGVRGVLVDEWKPADRATPPPIDLRGRFPGVPAHALKMSASRLVSRGLLHDEGIGKWGGRAMTFLIATDLADWFSGWISRDAG